MFNKMAPAVATRATQPSKLHRASSTFTAHTSSQHIPINLSTHAAPLAASPGVVFSVVSALGTPRGPTIDAALGTGAMFGVFNAAFFKIGQAFKGGDKKVRVVNAASCTYGSASVPARRTAAAKGVRLY